MRFLDLTQQTLFVTEWAPWVRWFVFVTTLLAILVAAAKVLGFHWL